VGGGWWFVFRRIEGFIWLDWVVDKLIEKHGVEADEVESAFFNRPYKLRRASSGKYVFYSQSDAGRYLFVVFAWEKREVRVISARDMTEAERRFFERKK
jgi:uncharacterized DUF497 family protein